MDWVPLKQLLPCLPKGDLGIGQVKYEVDGLVRAIGHRFCCFGRKTTRTVDGMPCGILKQGPIPSRPYLRACIPRASRPQRILQLFDGILQPEAGPGKQGVDRDTKVLRLGQPGQAQVSHSWVDLGLRQYALPQLDVCVQPQVHAAVASQQARQHVVAVKRALPVDNVGNMWDALTPTLTLKINALAP